MYGTYVCMYIDTSGELLREAMKKGYVEVTLVKVIIEGPAGVGKTCLIYLLLGKSPPSPEERRSTGCAERPIRVIRVGKEGEKWSEISTNEFQEIIAEAVPILCKELKAKAKASVDDGGVEDKMDREGEEGREGGEGEVGGEVEDEGKYEMGGEGKGKGKVGEERKPKEEEMSSKSTSARDSIDGVIKKLTDLVGSSTSSRRLLDMELIYITDCGGQQPFWDLRPIFTRDTSATILVNRLCEKLDDYPLNDLYQSGKRVGPSQRATLTTADAFKTMLRGQHEGKERSKIIAVGTHKDLAHECEETPEEKNKKFVDIASPYFKDDILYCNERFDEIIFQVNTIKPTEDDKEEARKIRETIEKGTTQHKIPIWWFILQLILENLALKLGRKVLSRDECVHVASSLEFSEGELDAALEFLDKLNVFLYKKHILPGVVFTNPQVPLDKLSKLVEKQYHLKAVETDQTKPANQPMTGEWQIFRDCGVLTLKFLKEEEFNDHYVEGIFTATDFLDLLQKLLVVAPLCDTKYFFPAILRMTEEAHINECLTSCRDTKIAALVVWFPTGWAPPGVYCCSICYLQSHSHWEVVDKAPKPCTTPNVNSEGTQHSQLRHISRNCITFTKHRRLGSVTIIDNFSFFVVCVNVDTSDMQQDELTEHCQAIRSDVFAAVEAGLKNTHHTDLHPEHAFLCPRQNESCSTELHTAHISDNGKRWICSQNSDVFSHLTPHQTVWLHELGWLCYIHIKNNIHVIHSSVATPGKISEPNAADFANYIVAKIPAEWKHVAIQLGLSGDKCDEIKKNEDECRDRFMAVFDEWKKGSCKPFTWSTLVTALKSPIVGKFELAKKVQQRFCS